MKTKLLLLIRKLIGSDKIDRKDLVNRGCCQHRGMPLIDSDEIARENLELASHVYCEHRGMSTNIARVIPLPSEV
jgi:hypothetical protein